MSKKTKESKTLKTTNSSKKNTPRKTSNTKNSNIIAKKINKKNSIAKNKSNNKTEKIIQKKSVAEKRKIPSFSPEYYDLPYRYNQTTVKILAQTPESLFVYWDISDSDREIFKKQYGKYFFEITKPVLIIHNETKKYSFEVEINDFANSWYLHINDSKCEYKIELGRRPIQINYNYIPEYNVEKNGPIEPIKENYIYISSSNNLKTPNDKILFNNQNKILFKNIKTNSIVEKDITTLFNSQYINNESSQYSLYKKLYKEDIAKNASIFLNPSSGNPSSDRI